MIIHVATAIALRATATASLPPCHRAQLLALALTADDRYTHSRCRCCRRCCAAVAVVVVAAAAVCRGKESE
jgi:hypothetical protein